MFTNLVVLIASILASPPIDPVKDQWPVFITGQVELAINPVDGSSEALPENSTKRRLSPDGSAIYGIECLRPEMHVIFLDLFVSSLTRDRDEVIQETEKRVLVSGTQGLGRVCWLSDSRHLLVELCKRDRTSTLYLADSLPTASKTPAKLVPIEGCNGDLGAVAIGAGDRVASFVIKDREGGVNTGDLVLVTAGKPRSVLKDVEVWSLAFSSDGSQLAVGMVGEIRVYSTVTPDAPSRVIKFTDIDKDLRVHIAEAIAWRPDGCEMAVRITPTWRLLNAGPVTIAERSVGWRELYLIPCEGETRTLHILPKGTLKVDEIRWMSPAQLNEARLRKVAQEPPHAPPQAVPAPK